MNSFDTNIIAFFNHFSHHSWIFDRTMVFITQNNLIKTGGIVIMIWWLWFREDVQKAEAREHIIATILACPIAMLVARTMALTLPLRLRPIHEAGLNFVMPYGMNKTVLDGWSSFPSDHAVLFFALSFGFIFVSRKSGILALLYTIFIISLPRIYLGLHYPTDIIIGAIIGILISWIANKGLVWKRITGPILDWSEAKPSLFYPLFFLVTYQIADVFESSRSILHALKELLKYVL